MDELTNSPALDLVIGLGFLYLLLSVICSAVNEAIAGAAALRAKELENGIRNLLGDPSAARNFYEHWRIQTLFRDGRKFGNKLPSYIPPRAFALTLLDTIAPLDSTAAAGGDAPVAIANDDLVARAETVVSEIASPRIRGLLEDALAEARGDRDRFQNALERSFNEVMDRVSGWYKRRVQLIIFALAVVIVSLANADTFTIGQRLWQDGPLRATVVAQASKASSASSCQSSGETETGSPIDKAANCVAEVRQLGLPLGWSKATTPSGGIEILSKVGGLLITVFAVLLGAPFWFDFLGKVSRLRGAGPRPGDPPATNDAR